MRHVCTAAGFLIAVLSTSSYAAEIHGRVLIATGFQVAPKAVVSIRCKSAPGSGTTDDHGSYRALILDEGECSVTVAHEGVTSNAITVYVSADRTKVNLTLQKLGEQWLLSRS